MSNLGRGRVKTKFRNSVLVQQNSSSFYSSFKVNLHIAYELNDWLYNPSHYFVLKMFYLSQLNETETQSKVNLFTMIEE